MNKYGQRTAFTNDEHYPYPKASCKTKHFLKFNLVQNNLSLSQTKIKKKKTPLHAGAEEPMGKVAISPSPHFRKKKKATTLFLVCSYTSETFEIIKG